MGFQSLIDMLQEEQHLCREIQTRINILNAAGQAHADGRTNSKEHWQLTDRLGCEIQELSGKLHEVRVEIGKQMENLLDLAEQAVMDKLYGPELERS